MSTTRSNDFTRRTTAANEGGEAKCCVFTKHQTVDTVTEDQMRVRLKREIEKAGGLRAYARAHDMALSQLSRAMAGTIPVPPLVLHALGLVRVVTYQQNGKEP